MSIWEADPRLQRERELTSLYDLPFLSLDFAKSRSISFLNNIFFKYYYKVHIYQFNQGHTLKLHWQVSQSEAELGIRWSPAVSTHCCSLPFPWLLLSFHIEASFPSVS